MTLAPRRRRRRALEVGSGLGSCSEESFFGAALGARGVPFSGGASATALFFVVLALFFFGVGVLSAFFVRFLLSFFGAASGLVVSSTSGLVVSSASGFLVRRDRVLRAGFGEAEASAGVSSAFPFFFMAFFEALSGVWSVTSSGIALEALVAGAAVSAPVALDDAAPALGDRRRRRDGRAGFSSLASSSLSVGDGAEGC